MRKSGSAGVDRAGRKSAGARACAVVVVAQTLVYNEVCEGAWGRWGSVAQPGQARGALLSLPGAAHSLQAGAGGWLFSAGRARV